MAEVKNKKKLATSAVALITAAAMLLGGTLAWQSISQEATNIVASAVNPGGRLHDDFDGSNDKNVYVENFGTQNIYARIKLSEYLEIGQNAGIFAEGTDRGDVVQHLGTDVDDKTTYETYLYGEDNLSDGYWTKKWAGSTKYIPTFNKDQDSLEADLNGTYEYVDETTGENKPYGDFVDWNNQAEGYSESEYEWFDADTNDIHEEHVNPDSVTAGSHDVVENANHTLADSISGTVISMADWDGTAGDYWVYDSDGWAYWANPIAPGTATGLLLDSITDLGYIDEDYYYAIHVTGQFITAGDLGDTNGTGFYADDEVPSDNALALLESIGVKVGAEEEIKELILVEDTDGNTVYADVNEKVRLIPPELSSGTEITGMTLVGVVLLADNTQTILETNQYNYDEDTDIIILTDDTLAGKTIGVVTAITTADGSVKNVGGYIQLNPIDSGEEDPGVTEPEYSIAVLSRTVNDGINDPYTEEYPGYMKSNDTWTFSLEENGAASDEAVIWSISETQVAGYSRLEGTDIDASSGVMTVAADEANGSSGSDSYDVFKIIASDAEGSVLAERNILICESGIRRETLAFYDNGVHVAANEAAPLEPGKTYDVRVAIQECATNTDVTDYFEPISSDNINSVGVSQWNGSEDVSVTNVYYQNGQFIVGGDASSGWYTLSLSVLSSSGINQTIYVGTAAAE